MTRASRWRRPSRPSAQFIADHDDIVFDHLVDAADDLYSEQVLLPLVRKAQASSPPSPTALIDVSADWLGGEAPEAIAAVLDFHYADGRHHLDYTVARWRLQYIAEISVGARLRAHVHQEDAKVRKLKSVV